MRVNRISIPETLRFLTVENANDLSEVAGAIVRLDPKEGEDVQELKETLLRAGAVKVIVLPQKKSATIAEEERKEVTPHQTTRETVNALLERITETQRVIVSAIAHSVLDEEGL